MPDLSSLTSLLAALRLPLWALLTRRCGRYIAGPAGWRRSLALWICRNLLDPFQLGGHCAGSTPGRAA